jgi:hypothetical protein
MSAILLACWSRALTDQIYTLLLVLLPALYLLALIVGVRWVLHRNEGLLFKAVLILAMLALVVVVSFVSWVVLYYAGGGH